MELYQLMKEYVLKF